MPKCTSNRTTSTGSAWSNTGVPPVQVSVKVASESPASVVNLNGVFVLFDLFGRFQVEIFGVSDVLFGKVPVVGPDNFVFDLVVFGLDIIEQGLSLFCCVSVFFGVHVRFIACCGGISLIVAPSLVTFYQPGDIDGNDNNAKYEEEIK